MLLGLEPHDALILWIWVARLWPLVLVGGFFVAFRSTLRNPIAFFGIGVLVCFGVQLIVGQVSLGLPVSVGEGNTPANQLVEGLLENLVRTTIVSSALAVAPLWWLRSLLRTVRSNV